MLKKLTAFALVVVASGTEMAQGSTEWVFVTREHEPVSTGLPYTKKSFHAILEESAIKRMEIDITYCENWVFLFTAPLSKQVTSRNEFRDKYPVRFTLEGHEPIEVTATIMDSTVEVFITDFLDEVNQLGEELLNTDAAYLSVDYPFVNKDGKKTANMTYTINNLPEILREVKRNQAEETKKYARHRDLKEYCHKM